MKILKVTQSYYPFLDRGGQAGTARELALGLMARSHQVTVLTADLAKGRRNDLGKKSQWGWRSYVPNLETIYLRTSVSFRATTLNPTLFSFCRQRLAEFDIVHIYGLYDLLGPAVARFSKRLAIPYFIEPMGMFRPIDRGFFLKSAWHRMVGSNMARNAWRVIATAELERQELIQDGIPAERVLLRHNPVDSAEYQSLPPKGAFRKLWGIEPDEPVVLFLSRLIPRKGADLLIESFTKALPDRGVLVIAGPEGVDGYLKRLQEVAAKCGVTERVRFTGPLYGEDKKAALTDADVFALPSSYENFANAVAEAVASGVPVVITERCGIHSLVKDRAGLVVQRDIKSIAEALHRLVSNRALREQLSAGCRAVADELSLDKTVSILEGFYRECGSRHTREANSPSGIQSRSAPYL